MIPTYLINLPRRTDRLTRCSEMLTKHGIAFEVFPAIEHRDGKEGIRATMLKLFDTVKDDQILVLEDDVDFIGDLSILPKAISELPKDFDLLFLGANVFRPAEPYSEHLLRLTGAVANHAVIYTRKVMERMLEAYRESTQPTDMILNDRVVRGGKSFITRPLLATQIPDYSDIEKKRVDYSSLLIDRYNKHCSC